MHPRNNRFLIAVLFAALVLPASASATTLYDQLSNAAPSDATDSYFYPPPGENVQVADDFTVPRRRTWTITHVDVTGIYWNGSGPCRDETVTFSRNRMP